MDEVHHTQIVVPMATGTAKQVFVSPVIRQPDKLHLVGYMTNGGKPGLPLLVTVGGVKSSAHAIVASTSEATTQNGSAIIVVSEPDKGKWQIVNTHTIARFDPAKQLHSFTVTVTDTSTGLPVAYTPTSPATDVVILKFVVSESKHFADVPLSSYTTHKMYNALG